jgi:hypothetical protein
LALLPLACTAALLTACGHGDQSHGPTSPTYTGPTEEENYARTHYDFARYGMPVFIEAHHIDYARVEKISRFRSAAGHDNADSFESCRSMKHYFQPTELVPIYSPVTGTVVAVSPENSYGYQIGIHPLGKDYFNVRIYHLVTSLRVGDLVTAGQVVGTHVTLATSDDVAIEITTTTGLKLVSYFDVMPDSLFAQLAAYGITSRSQLIISQGDRDADPLGCSTNGGFFTNGHIPNFVNLPDGSLSGG